VKLFVVRHVKAGSRSSWNGDDIARPISKGGRKQAEALAVRLADEGISRLLTSPYVRCHQSLEPLGEVLGLPVVDDDRLAEGAPLDGALAVVAEAPDRTVLCSHGDVIPELIAGLVRRGMDLATHPDWRKATLWVLEGPGGDAGFTTAAVEPPPPPAR
jgi:phosphohistidine phosphatase SixA